MMEAKTIQERIRMAGRQRLPWDSSMSLDDMERACAVIDAVAAEFGDDLAYNPATHIVVSRDSLAALLDYWFGDCPNDKFASACQGANKLRAALEGEK